MRGLWLENGLILREDLPDPPVPAGEALIKVRLAGICGTDLELVEGYLGFRGVPGHEFVGEVVEAPRGGPPPGTRVVGEINAACGRCRRCREGRRNHCADRTVLGILGRQGAFAEYLTLPVENLHAVPEGLADEEAVFVEPLAAACRILDQIEVGPGLRAAVLGDGRLGHLVALTLKAAGADVTVLGRHPERLAKLTERGFTTSPSPGPHLERFGLTVDCTGKPSGFSDALRLCEPTGILVLKSTYHGPADLALTPVVIDEIRVIGSRCGPFPPAIRALEAGDVPVRDLVEGIYPLSDGIRAMQSARGALKILLAPDR
jgi:threonine dehydrogenase-like Zn-dependent dehydrogenase